MTINTVLEEILVWLSNQLCDELKKNPYDIDEYKKHYAKYLKESQEVLLDLANSESVFYVIPRDNAIEIVANSIYQNYPNIKCMGAGDKSQIYNTLRSKITEFFINNGQTTTNPVIDITIADT